MIHAVFQAEPPHSSAAMSALSLKVDLRNLGGVVFMSVPCVGYGQ